MRFRRISWLVAASLCLLHSRGRAAENPDDSSGFLPRSQEVFKPLLADPRDLQFSVRPVLPVGHNFVGDAAMGGYLGLYRWQQPEADRSEQLSIGGGAFGRFDLSGSSNDMQSVDFYANLPFDFRQGPWSSRFMLYHTSSHLGDDYVSTHGGMTTKHSWDNLRFLISNDLTRFLRLYGGYTFAFRTLPEDIGRNALQGGIECTSGWHGHDHFQLYWANDFQSWERISWNPIFTSQAGVKLAEDPRQGRALLLFVEFETGGQPQGQFYLQKQTLWDIGLRFELS